MIALPEGWSMDYLHCPSCRCAYNVAAHAGCPACGRSVTSTSSRLALVSPIDAVVAAAEQLARAVARATPVELAKAQAELAVRDACGPIVAPSQLPQTSPAIMRAVRAALAPRAPTEAVVPRGQQALLATIALALLTRLPRRPNMRTLVSMHVLPRVAAARALLAFN